MSGEINLGDDSGYVTIRFGETKVELDLYLAYNKLLDLDDMVPVSEEGKQPRGSWLEMVVAWMRDLGFENPSHRLANQFAKAIFARVNELKNADGGSPNPGSPDSTEQGS